MWKYSSCFIQVFRDTKEICGQRIKISNNCRNFDKSSFSTTKYFDTDTRIIINTQKSEQYLSLYSNHLSFVGFWKYKLLFFTKIHISFSILILFSNFMHQIWRMILIELSKIYFRIILYGIKLFIKCWSLCACESKWAKTKAIPLPLF